MVSIGEFAAKQGLTNRQTFATARASMVEDLVAVCPGLGAEHGVGHPSSGVGPCQCQENEFVDEIRARPPASVAGTVPFSG